MKAFVATVLIVCLAVPPDLLRAAAPAAVPASVWVDGRVAFAESAKPQIMMAFNVDFVVPGNPDPLLASIPRTVSRNDNPNPGLSEYDRLKQIDDQLKAGVAAVDKKVDAIKGDWSLQGVVLAQGTAEALVMTRDIYVQQLDFFLKTLAATQNLTFDQKRALVTQLLPAVRQAKLWKGMIDIYRSGSLADWHDYFEARYQEAMAAGDKATASLIETAMSTRNGRAAAESFMLQQYFQALNSNPLVASLVNAIDGPANGQPGDYLDAFDLGLANTLAKTQAERDRAAGINTVEGLSEFLNPQYQKVWQAAASSLGPYSQQIFKHFSEFAAAHTNLKYINDHKWDDVLMAAVVGLAVIAIVIPPLAIAAGAKAFAGTVIVGTATASVLASGTQLVWDGQRWSQISTQADNAAAGQVAVGAEAVHQLDEKKTEAAKKVFLDAGIVVVDAVGLGFAVGEARVLSKAQAADDAMKALKGTEISASKAESILDRLKVEVRDIYNKPGDMAFFKEAGLVPNKTITAGGRTFHITPPFSGPGGRTTVVAFEEAADGSVVARTFYLSNEHGIWKSALGVNPKLIMKGPMKQGVFKNGVYVRDAVEGEALAAGEYTKDIFVNEAVADVAAELQAPLFNQLKENGVKTLEGDAAKRAFGAHLDADGSAANNVLAAAHGENQVTQAITKDFKFTPGATPDLSKGPVTTWTFEHPLYGPTQGFVFVSEDGKTVYTVLRAERNGQVRVWVPSIQEAGAEITPFGTRTTAIDSEMTATPGRHVRTDRNGISVEPAGTKYLDDAKEYVDVESDAVNGLTNFFYDKLPASPAGAAAGTSRTAAALGTGAGIETTRGSSSSPSSAVPPSPTRPTTAPRVATNWPGSGASAVGTKARAPQPADVEKVSTTPELDKAAQLFDDSSTVSKEARVKQAAAVAKTVSLLSLPGGGANGSAGKPPLQIAMTSLGSSTGTAFQLQAINNTPSPIHIVQDGVVLEPVSGGGPETRLAAATGGGVVTKTVEGFCLERTQRPPQEGVQYRVAPPEMQTRFGPLVRVLQGADRVKAALHPDSDPNGYFNAIRQWSIWAKQENFDQKRFTDEFVAQTKKNLEQMPNGPKWNGDLEKTVRSIAPNRWNDIQAVLNESNKMKRSSPGGA